MGPRTRGVALTTFAPDPPRRMVPRWRFLSDRKPAPESSGDPRRSSPVSIDPLYLEQRLQLWSRDPSLTTAADVITGALTTGCKDKAIDAAQFIIENGSGTLPTVLAHAKRCLGLPSEESSDGVQLSAPDLGTEQLARGIVSQSRHRISRDARNMEAWLDMSRAYAVLGQEKQAKRAMDRALIVAPDHRLSLRAAVRLHLHYADPERAAAILAKHARTRTDPWLLASEIAMNSILARTSKLIRHAKPMIESGRLPASQLTELYGAMATLDFYNGSVRRTRQHTRSSLEDPNDNAVAQARWLSTLVGGLEIKPAAFDIVTSYEARCWRAMQKADWSVALTEAREWLLDEPFTSRPAVQASFIATSLIENYDLAESFTTIGLLAAPTNAMLLNNRTVIQIRKGNVTAAAETFRKIPAGFSNEHPEYVHLATRGLLSFRSGRPEDGRRDYERATQIAPSGIGGRVIAHWVREELEIDPQCAPLADEICQTALNTTKDPITRRVLELLRQRAIQVSSNNATHRSILPTTSSNAWLKQLETKYPIHIG